MGWDFQSHSLQVGIYSEEHGYGCIGSHTGAGSLALPASALSTGKNLFLQGMPVGGSEQLLVSLGC